MQRSSSAKYLRSSSAKYLYHQIRTSKSEPCNLFINHCSIDTKWNLAGLLYDQFVRLNLHPFLYSKNMKPGDKLFEKIDMAIRDCKVGIAVFSPRYCDSYFCLHELSLLMESKKRVIPIFCDVKPSELRVKYSKSCPPKELHRFRWALEEAKYTVGLAFDTSKGDWSDLLSSASDAVMKNLIEVEEERLVDDEETKKKKSNC